MAESISRDRTLPQTRHLARYSIDGQIHSILRCCIDDIPVHSERVLSFWEDHEMQLNAMKKAVESGAAYKLVSDRTHCFLYGIPYSKNLLCGMAFWCELKCHAVAGYMFIRDHTRFRRIYWKPHKMDRMPLAFILEDRMITDYWNGAEFVSINIPSTKLEALRRFQTHKHKISEV